MSEQSGDISPPARSGRAIRAACLLLLGDLALVLVHLATRLSGFSDDPRLMISRDGGYAEIYQYAKVAAVLALLAWLYTRRPRVMYLAFACVFSYILADDVLQVHETLGGWVAKAVGLGPALGLRAKDFGEVAVSASFGSALLGLLGFAYLRSPARERRFTWGLLGLLAALAFFGVVVDMAHGLLNHTRLSVALEVLEDGGEMAIMSVTVGYVATLALSSDAGPSTAPSAS